MSERRYLSQLQRWIAPLRRKVGGMIAKALIESVTDSSDLQLVKITSNGEVHSDVERVQNYGFTSRPTKGAQAVVAFIGGNRDNPVIIACDDGRTRVELAAGEVAMYNDQGTRVVLRENNTVEITCTELTVNGNVRATGTVRGELDVVAGVSGVPLTNVSLKLHTHSGVTTGPGVSGAPVPT